MLKFYKIMFLLFLISGTLVSISSSSWMLMWLGLEINLLAIIPLMSSTKNMFSAEAAMKYFITQSLASLILLFSVILMLMSLEFIPLDSNFTLTLIMETSLLTKMGAAPFHFWFPEVVSGLDWLNCLIIFTWQKIAPMILFINSSPTFFFTQIIMIFNLVISTISALNQSSLRKILAFSSMNHMAWLLGASLISYSSWLIYFFIYSLMNLMLIMFFYLTNTFFINQLNMNFNFNKLYKISFITNFLSLGGLPPFLGFLPKWLVINSLIEKNLIFITLILIIFTLIMLYVYLRLTLSSLILNYQESKIPLMKNLKFTLNFINLMNISALIFSTLTFNFL